jgi:hypothetical protein
VQVDDEGDLVGQAISREEHSTGIDTSGQSRPRWPP